MDSNSSKLQLVVEENFQHGWEENWVVEGKPDLKVASGGFIDIKTIGPNVLWYKRPFKGNVEVDFDAYVKSTNAKPILFFMAHPINGKPFFSGTRGSFYGDYAWDRIMGLYSIGFLRDLRADKDTSNFRYLGGHIKDDWRNLTYHSAIPDFKKYWKSQEQYQQSWNEYERDSKPSDASDGCTEIDKVYHFTAKKNGNRIQFFVNGKMIHDVKHDAAASNAFFIPPEEGYLGFRNFVPNSEVWIGNIKVYEIK